MIIIIVIIIVIIIIMIIIIYIYMTNILVVTAVLEKHKALGKSAGWGFTSLAQIDTFYGYL